MAVFNNILAGASGQTAGGAAAGYEIERSLRFDSSASSYLNRTPEAAGNRKTFTWSGWVKRAKLGTAQSIFTAGTDASTEYDTIEFASNDQIYIYSYSYPSFVYDLRTTQVFRDVSAWYHIVLSVDTTNSTANDRVKLYVNGVRVETFSTNSPPSQNVDSAYWNTANPHYIGYSISRFPADKYLADVHFIDGQALTADDFGEFDANGVWQPKEFVSPSPNNGTTWSATTNGNFNTSISRGADKAFNGNVGGTDYAHANTGTTATVSSLGITGITSIRVNIAKNNTGDNWGTFALDSTDLTSWLQTNYPSVGNSGTWIDVSSQFTSSTLGSISITTDSDGVTDVRLAGVEINGYVLIDGATAYGTNGFHLPFSDNSSTIALGTDTSVTVSDVEANKGMDVVTYTGNGSTQTINGLRFAPDFVWIKVRNYPYNHNLFDTVRGNTKHLSSNLSNSEYTESSGYGLTGFTSDGFSLGTDVQGPGSVNASGGTYVAWCWKAGGPAVTNTNGSITSQVSANQDYGFSVVSYTGNGTDGATVGHGLANSPSLIFTKNRDGGSSGSAGGWWSIYHPNLPNKHYYGFNAEDPSDSVWNNHGYIDTVSSSTFTLNTGDYGGTSEVNNWWVNASGKKYISYVWSEVSGFSKFGSYSGTGSAGVSVTTGFKPRWVMIKETTNANQWFIYDTRRGTTNILWANDSSSESTIGAGDGVNQNAIEVNSTGFTIPHTLSGTNRSGGTFIYAAFASEPGNNWALNNFVANQTSTGFKAVTYTGNLSTQTISGVGFSPSLVWFKNRDAVKNHALVDVVRGGDKVLQSSTTGAEGTASNFITSFTSDGFTIGNDSAINGSGNGIVAWCWDAGSSTVTNTAGSINSQVRANTDLGFSIVTFDATSAGGSAVSVGHGLGKRPDMFIVKSRDNSATGWYTWHQGLSNLQENRLFLHGTNTEAGNTSIWNNTAPTDTLLHIGSDPHNNDNCVAYCFTSKPGVSAFGSYTGNGSSTGPVITTGFEPAFLIIKNRTGAGGAWVMYDNVRDTGDPKTLRLFANSSTGDSTGANPVSFLANGFQPKDADSYTNANNQTYIYIAFASPPSGEEIDSLLDSPTEANVDSDTGAGGEVSGNYATLNPLVGGATLSNGNLDYTTTANTATSTIGVTSGKYYAEVTAGGSGAWIGITNNPNERLDSVDTNTIAVIDGDGDSYDPSSTQTYTSYSGFSAGDVIGIALDATNLTVDFYVNNTKVKTYTTFTVDGPYFFAIDRSSAVTQTFSWNWGQRPFAYTAPTGYQPLTTALFDDPTIADGSTAMDVVTYSSTNAIQAITLPGSGFQPDFVWTKSRSNAYQHDLYDAVRGAGSYLVSNSTAAAGYDANTLKSFDSAGFTLGNSDDSNFGSGTSVAWCWDGGTTTDTNNTAGTITPTGVRANASAGFSIVTYTGNGTAGATVGHGLGVASQFILIKQRNTAGASTTNWWVYHASLGATKGLQLNLTDGEFTSTSLWNDTAPTSTVFTLGSGSERNYNTGTYVAYCFAPVEGYSAFGSYTGNGSTDGPFVYTGFRPKWLMIKIYSGTTSNWVLLDAERDPNNVVQNNLYADTSDAENQFDWADFLSNGFKPRVTYSQVNGSGYSYIYAAFAEHPFKYARAR